MDLYELLFLAAFYGAMPLTAVFVVAVLILCRGRNWKHLVWAAGIAFGTAVLLFAGEKLLNVFGLAWRNRVAGGLCIVLFLSGLLAILLMLGCLLSAEMKELAPVLRWLIKGIALLCAGLTVCFALFYGGFFAALAYGGGEQVVEYRGKTLVEVEDHWLDTVYEYYAYRGPFVRGEEALYKSLEAHIWEENRYE